MQGSSSMDQAEIDHFQVDVIRILYSNSPDYITLIDSNPTASLLLVLIAIKVLARSAQYSTLQSRTDLVRVEQRTRRQYYSIPAAVRQRSLLDFVLNGPHPQGALTAEAAVTRDPSQNPTDNSQ